MFQHFIFFSFFSFLLYPPKSLIKISCRFVGFVENSILSKLNHIQLIFQQQKVASMAHGEEIY